METSFVANAFHPSDSWFAAAMWVFTSETVLSTRLPCSFDFGLGYLNSLRPALTSNISFPPSFLHNFLSYSWPIPTLTMTTTPTTVLTSPSRAFLRDQAPIKKLLSLSLSHQNEMGAFLSTNERPLKSHPLDLTIDTLHNDVDPWPIEWMMFNILNAYLQPGSNLSDNEAARCLDAILPDNRPPQPDEEKKEPAVNWMIELSDLIWKIAKQIPCDHEGQDKLVQLLHALKRLPITQTIKNWRGRQLSAWNGFSHWDDSMRHAIGYPEKRHGKSPSQQECDYYVNGSAFAARVYAARAEYPLECEAFCAIETAVEGVIPDDKLLPCHVIGGAQWLVWATEWLWGDIRWGRIDYHELRNDGSKYLDFPPALWVRWLHGFQKVAAIGEGDVKYWAVLAVTKMEEMMSTQGFTAEVMKDWDPEKRSLRASIWEDEKYAHLFKVPEIKVPECKFDEKA